MYLYMYCIYICTYMCIYICACMLLQTIVALKLLHTHKRPAPCIFLLVVLGIIWEHQSHEVFAKFTRFSNKWSKRSDQDHTSPS